MVRRSEMKIEPLKGAIRYTLELQESGCRCPDCKAVIPVGRVESAAKWLMEKVKDNSHTTFQGDEAFEMCSTETILKLIDAAFEEVVKK